MIGVVGVPVECPACGQPVDRIVTQAAPKPTGTRGVVACANRHEWLLQVTLASVRNDAGPRGPRDQQPAQPRPARPRQPRHPEALCGTLSGYNRHRRLGEPACEPCRDAFNAYQRDRRDRMRRAS